MTGPKKRGRPPTVWHGPIGEAFVRAVFVIRHERRSIKTADAINIALRRPESQGQNMVDAIRQIGVSEVTYYRWRQEFGGLKTEQVKRLKPGVARGNLKSNIQVSVKIDHFVMAITSAEHSLHSI